MYSRVVLVELKKKNERGPRGGVFLVDTIFPRKRTRLGDIISSSVSIEKKKKRNKIIFSLERKEDEVVLNISHSIASFFCDKVAVRDRESLSFVREKWVI